MSLNPKNFVLLLFVGASQMAVGSDETVTADEFTPAVFVAGKRLLENLIRFPNTDHDIDIIVACTSHGTKRGRVSEARCSSIDDPDGTFSRAASRRTGDARIEPGSVNGRKVDVDLQFNVVFTRNDKIESIAVYTNNRQNIERYGVEYTSAQRYSPHVRPAACSGGNDDVAILEMATVGVDGTPRNVGIYSGENNISPECKQGFLQQLETGHWIPAFHNGVPVESAWVNSWILPRTR